MTLVSELVCNVVHYYSHVSYSSTTYCIALAPLLFTQQLCTLLLIHYAMIPLPKMIITVLVMDHHVVLLCLVKQIRFWIPESFLKIIKEDWIRVVILTNLGHFLLHQEFWRYHVRASK